MPLMGPLFPELPWCDTAELISVDSVMSEWHISPDWPRGREGPHGHGPFLQDE